MRVLSSSLVARLPLGMSELAMILVMREAGASFGSAGVVAGAFTLSGAISTPMQGRLIGRWGFAPVLSICAPAHAVALVSFAVAASWKAPYPGLIVLAGVAGAMLPPISACSRSLWPVLTPEPDSLEAAYAVDAMSQELIWTCGPLIVALAVIVDSGLLAASLAAAFTIIGTAWFVTASAVRHHEQGRRVVGRHSRPWLARIAPLLLSLSLAGFSNGVLVLALPALAAHLRTPSASGALLAMLSVGSVVGGLYYGGRSWAASHLLRYRVLLCLSALFALPLTAAQSLPEALAFSGVAGLAWSSLLSCEFSLINAAAPRGDQTEAFAWNTSALIIGLAAGTAGAGVAVDLCGVHFPFLLVAVGSLLALAATATANNQAHGSSCS